MTLLWIAWIFPLDIYRSVYTSYSFMLTYFIYILYFFIPCFWLMCGWQVYRGIQILSYQCKFPSCFAWVQVVTEKDLPEFYECIVKCASTTGESVNGDISCESGDSSQGGGSWKEIHSSSSCSTRSKIGIDKDSSLGYLRQETAVIIMV